MEDIALSVIVQDPVSDTEADEAEEKDDPSLLQQGGYESPSEIALRPPSPTNLDTNSPRPSHNDPAHVGQVGDSQVTSQHPEVVFHPAADDPDSPQASIKHEILHFLKEWKARPGENRVLSQADVLEKVRDSIRSFDTVTNADSSAECFTAGVVDTEKASHDKAGEYRQLYEVHQRSTEKHPATFQCTLCPKRFIRAGNLRNHLRTHTQERPFVCKICNKAFARLGDKNRHEGHHRDEE